MSVVNKAIGGKITNCIFKGVPIRTIWPMPIKPGPGIPGAPKCLPRLCLTYINPSDPLSCSYIGPRSHWDWHTPICMGPGCGLPVDPCLIDGGKLIKNLINFQWNFQRRTFYSNENFKNVFSPRYNKDSAIKILTDFKELEEIFGGDAFADSFIIEYTVNDHDCHPNGTTTYDYTISENSPPTFFEMLAHNQDNHDFDWYINAKIKPISQVAYSRYDISNSVNTDLTRYRQGSAYSWRGWQCGYQQLNSIFGEVQDSYREIRFIKGNRPNNAPPLTFPIEGL